MSIFGIWCDNIIIQVVVSEFYCVIYIIELRFSCLEGLIIIILFGNQEIIKVLFVGYIEDLYYVFIVLFSRNIEVFEYFKFKLFEIEVYYKERLEVK